MYTIVWILLHGHPGFREKTDGFFWLLSRPHKWIIHIATYHSLPPSTYLGIAFITHIHPTAVTYMYMYMNIKNCMNNVYQLGSFPTMWERPETKNSCRDEEWRMYSYVLGSFSILSGVQKMVCILNSNVLWTAKQLLFSAKTMHQHVKLIYICMHIKHHMQTRALHLCTHIC